MAPKRSAPQPPPPPPAASSEETGSGTGSEETDEEEEEIAYSPPPAAPKNPAPPPQVAQESEGEDDDEEEEDDDDGQEDERTNQNQVAPPPATKKPSSPPPNHEESETSDEEGDEDTDEEGDEETDEEGDEETDEEAPQPQPQLAPVQEAATAKPPSLVTESKKPSAPFQRTWSTDDEVRILEALDAHRAEDGTLPQADALVAALAGSLDNSGCSASDLQKKVQSLKSRYRAAAKKGELPNKDHDRRLFELSKKAWGSVTTAAANNGGALRDVSEMRELYPYLAEEVNALEKAHRGLFKREFAMISDDKARALDLKIKKSRLAQMKLYQRRHDLIKEVTKTLIDLAD